MYEAKKAGIVETVMSALSLLIVRNRPVANVRRRPKRGRAPQVRVVSRSAPPRKESYFETSPQYRWNR